MKNKSVVVDYGLIHQVMKMIDQEFPDDDRGAALSRTAKRMLAEAIGLPLDSYRLLKEKPEEIKPIYRKDYELVAKVDPYCSFYSKGQCYRPNKEIDACWKCRIESCQECQEEQKKQT